MLVTDTLKPLEEVDNYLLKSRVCSPRALITTTAAPPHSDFQWKQMAQIGKIPGECEVLIIGDSMGRRFPNSLIARCFDTPDIINLCIGGFKTQNVLWIISDVNISRMKARKVLITIGTNNLYYDDAEAIAYGISAINKTIKRTFSPEEVYILLVPPVLFSGKKYRESERLKLNNIFREKSFNHEMAPVDCEDALADRREMYNVDGLHLSVAGYKCVSSRIRDIFPRSQNGAGDDRTPRKTA